MSDGAFLLKGLVLLAASTYLLEQDVTRVITARRAEMAPAMR